MQHNENNSQCNSVDVPVEVVASPSEFCCLHVIPQVPPSEPTQYTVTILTWLYKLIHTKPYIYIPRVSHLHHAVRKAVIEANSWIQTNVINVSHWLTISMSDTSVTETVLGLEAASILPNAFLLVSFFAFSASNWTFSALDLWKLETTIYSSQTDN